MNLATFLSRAAGVAALAIVLTASDCSNKLSFTPPVDNEICTDAIDNDNDGRIDCRDADCLDRCRPEIAFDPVPTVVTADSLALAGTSLHAASITISSSPSGAGGAAQISGARWTFMLRTLVNGEHTATAVVVDSTGALRDTATASFRVAW